MTPEPQRCCAALFVLLFLLLNSTAVSQTDTLISSDLPLVVIDTYGQEIPDDPKITAFMGVIDNGPGQRNYRTDSATAYRGYIGIEIRGFSSQQFPKLQYGIELRDSLGEDVSVPLLGMSSDADWVLSAGYNDKSLMRNALAYLLANRMGRYAARSRFVELILNGEYRGVYVLFEKLKRDKNRINVTKITTADVSGDKVTGGYILQIDRAGLDSTEYWYSPYLPPSTTNRPVSYTHEFPKPEDLVPAQREYIQSFITSFEGVMSDSLWADPVNGYRKYLDVSSAIDYLLVNEAARNIDAYRLSTFLYKDRDSKDSKLHVGPVWDFDLGFGNTRFSEGADTIGWDLVVMPGLLASSVGEYHIPQWWIRLSEDSTFWQAAGTRWAALRRGPLSTPAIMGMIDSIAAHIDEAQARNFVRWPILDQDVWENPYVGGTYANEVSYLKAWTTARLAWMDTTLPPPPPDTLAVTLDSLGAEVAYDLVHLRWRTTLEKHTVAFRVERRSADSLVADTSWMAIRTVPAADSSAVPRWYASTDTLQGPATYQYRVMTLGPDSQTAVSAPITISVGDTQHPLEVAFSAFTAGATDSVVTLVWETNIERNTVSFVVERRSADSLAADTTWTTRGMLPAADSSSATLAYAFRDTVAGPAGLAYRIMATGVNGQRAFSAARTVQVAAPDDTLRADILTFTGRYEQTAVAIRWIATHQANIMGYGIERRRLLPAPADSVWYRVDSLDATGAFGDSVTYTSRDSLTPGGQVAYRLRIIGVRGQEMLTPEITVMLLAVGDRGGEIPAVFDLAQNYPNPFNPSTTIRFDLPVHSPVVLTVYSMLGQRIAVLVNEELPAGRHEVRFDASSLPSGVYVYSMQAGSFIRHRKLLLLR